MYLDYIFRVHNVSQWPNLCHNYC